MRTILPSDPFTCENPSLIECAARVDVAAELIADAGLEVGDYWTDALVTEYEPGVRCDAVGALAAACGYRRADLVESQFVGMDFYDFLGHTLIAGEPHPVLKALLWELRCTEIEQAFNWSDSAREDQVVARLREAAASMRSRAALQPRTSGLAVPS